MSVRAMTGILFISILMFIAVSWLYALSTGNVVPAVCTTIIGFFTEIMVVVLNSIFED